MTKSGIILLVFGIIYLLRPGIYREWLRESADHAYQWLSPAGNIKFMRILGMIFATTGATLLLVGTLK